MSNSVNLPTANTQAFFKNKLMQQAQLDLSSSIFNYACVAIIFRKYNNQIEVGFIRRAIDPNDRWSGQVAFPGGKKDAVDNSDLDTTIRETLEEVGLQLTENNLLGRIDDIQARKHGQMLEFFIRPFVFYIEVHSEPVLDPAEVADFFWLPFNYLFDAKNQTEHQFTLNNMLIKMPAIRMNEEPHLWGLTYLMLQNLREYLQK